MIRQPLPLILVCAALLAGCATTTPPDPKVVVKFVNIPTPVPCAPDLGPDPAYADTPQALTKAQADIYQQVKLLLQGRLQRDYRLTELSAAMKACNSIGQLPAPTIAPDAQGAAPQAGAPGAGGAK